MFHNQNSQQTCDSATNAEEDLKAQILITDIMESNGLNSEAKKINNYPITTILTPLCGCSLKGRLTSPPIRA